MIKNLLTISLIFLGIEIFAQTTFTASYNFALTTTVSGTTDPTTPPIVTGITCGSFQAVGTGTASSAAGRFSFNTWPIGSPTTAATYTDMTGAINVAEYYEVTLTPQTGYTVTVDSITFKSQRSGTGVRSYASRCSVDGYINNLPASVNSTVVSIQGTNEFFYNSDVTTAVTGNKLNFTGLAPFNSTDQAVTFRWYGWNSEGSAGTFSIDDVTFFGSITLATGLNKLSYDLNAGFVVYPVPSQDGVLYIENKNSLDLTKIEVLDVLGNVVLSSNPKIENRIKLNLSEMPSGNYFVRMYSGNNVTTKKIAVVK